MQPAAKPQSQPSHTKMPTQSGSGSEEKEQAQPVATESKKRKWSSEAYQAPISSTSAAQNGGLGGSVGEKSDDEEDLSWAQLSLRIDKEESMIKQGLELLGGEKRAKVEKAWKKLQVVVKKLRAESQALVEEQLMDCCLSDHSLSSLEEEEEEEKDCLSDLSLSSLEEEEEEEEEEKEAEAEAEEEHMQQTEASINPAKEQVQMEEEDGKEEKSE